MAAASLAHGLGEPWHHASTMAAPSWLCPGTILALSCYAWPGQDGDSGPCAWPMPTQHWGWTLQQALCWAAVPHHTKLHQLLLLYVPGHAVTHLHRTMPFHAISHSSILHHTLPCRAVPCSAMPHCVFPCHPPHTIQCHAVLCHAVLFHAIPCHATQCSVTPFHAVPCGAVQCGGAGTGAGVAHPAPPSAQAQTRPCPGAAQQAAAGGSGK